MRICVHVHGCVRVCDTYMYVYGVFDHNVLPPKKVYLYLYSVNWFTIWLPITMTQCMCTGKDPLAVV